MKGVFFVRPLELKVDVTGEKWGQGDVVKGTLTVTNHHTEETNLTKIGVTLANADLKKMTAKDPKAFNTFEKIYFQDNEILQVGESKELHWSFPLPLDFPLSQKSSTPCLVFGPIEQLELGGILQLQVGPVEIINKYIELFENFLRFKNKGMKSKKGHIEYKLHPPGSKEFGFIESLTLQIRLDSEAGLDINYHFTVSKMSYEGMTVGSKKEEVKINQCLQKKDYLIYGDAINQELVLEKIKAAITEAKGSNFFAKRN